MTRHGPRESSLTTRVRAVVIVTTTLASALVLSACGSRSAAPPVKPGVIAAVGAESQYANVLSQIGGRYVSVSSILNNPNIDPHAYEASPTVAQEVSQAQVIIQNGLGYDSFMNDIESASPSASRMVIVVQHVLGVPNRTPNPHLWYKPSTMPAVAHVIASDLTILQPGHKAYFAARLQLFLQSLRPWTAAIASFRARYQGASVAVTEPVADYLLTAMGLDIKTPFVFQADVMNGVDPAPEDITLEDSLFTHHDVKVFCYNEQVVDSLTTAMRSTARAAGVPVVGVYETMPVTDTYQAWMLDTVNAIEHAIAHTRSIRRPL